MQSSMTEHMLSSTGNASTTQRLLEGQSDPTATAKAKPEAWMQAGKNLLQRVAVTGELASAAFVFQQLCSCFCSICIGWQAAH